MNWFRFYSEALDDPKVQRLPGDLFKAWVNLLCLANKSRNRGMIPCVADVAFALRVDEDAASRLIEQLVGLDLLEYDAAGVLWPHNWTGRQPTASDDAAARQRQHRAKTAPPPPDPPLTPVATGHVTSNVTSHATAVTTGLMLEQSRSESEESENRAPAHEAAPILPGTPGNRPPDAPRPVPKPSDDPAAKTFVEAELRRVYPLRNGVLRSPRVAISAVARVPQAEWPALLVAARHYAESVDGQEGYPKDVHNWIDSGEWREWINGPGTPRPARASPRASPAAPAGPPYRVVNAPKGSL